MYFPDLKVFLITDAHLMYSTARIRKHIRADCFRSCDLRCSKAECILLPCLFRYSNPMGLRYSRGTPTGPDCSYPKRNSRRLFLQLWTGLS